MLSESKRKKYLAALEKVAAGRGLSRPERIRRGLTWRAVAKEAGVTREHLFKLARLLEFDPYQHMAI